MLLTGYVNRRVRHANHFASIRVWYATQFATRFAYDVQIDSPSIRMRQANPDLNNTGIYKCGTSIGRLICPLDHFHAEMAEKISYDLRPIKKIKIKFECDNDVNDGL